jgi:hypothetical protein
MLPDANPIGWRFAFLGPLSRHLLEEVESCQDFFLGMENFLTG